MAKGVSTLPLVGLLGFSTSGCAAIKTATPFLGYLAEEAVRSFGLNVGEDLADKAADLTEEAVKKLKSSLGEDDEIASTIYGYAPNLEDPTPLSMLIASVFEKDNGTPVWKSQAVIKNGDDLIEVPSVLALGASIFATEKLKKIEGASEEKVTAASRKTLRQTLRSEYSIRSWEELEGGEDLTTKTVYRAVTTNSRNLQVTWDPTTERTKLTRIEIQEGLVLEGKDEKWDLAFERGIPSDMLWEVD
ncbi:MAG: hypothetical protein ACRCYU_18645 [Nocardioides sp.]